MSLEFWLGFATGMVVGMAGTVVVALVVRILFAGALDRF